jgi:hypothetical protein
MIMEPTLDSRCACTAISAQSQHLRLHRRPDLRCELPNAGACRRWSDTLQ